MGELVDPLARGASVERRTSPSLVKDTFYANHRAICDVADGDGYVVTILFMAHNKTRSWIGILPVCHLRPDGVRRIWHLDTD